MSAGQRQGAAEPQAMTGLRLLADGILLALALTGTAFSFCSLYGVLYEPGTLLLICLLSAGAALAVYALPRHRAAALLAVLLVYGYALWQLWPEVAEGFRVTAYWVLDVMNADMPSGLAELPVELLRSREAAVWFFAAALGALGLLLGWSVVRGRSVILVFLLTFSWLLPGLLLDEMPDWPAFLALVICWCVMLLCSLCGRHDPNGGARFALLCLPPVTLTVLLLTLALPQEDYTQPDWAQPARLYLERKAGALTEPGGALESVVAALSGDGAELSVDLEQDGPRAFSGRTVMTVTSQLPGTFYLRGSASARYTGGAWEPLPEEAYEGLDLTISPLNYPSLAAAGEPYYEMEIDYASPRSGWMFTPYRLSTSPAEVTGVSFVQDAYLERRFGVKKKNVFFRPLDGAPEETPELPWDAAKAEAQYRLFVQEHYLDVPEGFEEVFYTWLTSLSPEMISEAMEAVDWNYGSYGNALSFAELMAYLLDRSTTYDLGAPATPEGEDFVDYFLNDSRRGYCVHYATAGVLLLRLNGIPARYVSGYTVEIPRKDAAATVPDSAAHAWVEIYLDGYGWYPMEMTPSSGTGLSPDALLHGAPEEEEEKPETPKPETPETPKPEREERPERPDRLEPELPAKQPKDKAEKSADPWKVLRWVLPAALLAALIPLRRWACGRLRRRRFLGPDTNAAAVAAYVYLSRLAPWGAAMEPEVEALARKARFSQHRLSEAERARALLLVEQARARLDQTLPPLRRWAFRWLRAL